MIKYIIIYKNHYLVLLKDDPNPCASIISLTILLAFLKSSNAPVVLIPLKTSSAALPPKIHATSSNKSCLCFNSISDGKYCANPNAPFDLGLIVSFSNGFPPFKNHPTIA